MKLWMGRCWWVGEIRSLVGHVGSAMCLRHLNGNAYEAGGETILELARKVDAAEAPSGVTGTWLVFPAVGLPGITSGCGGGGRRRGSEIEEGEASARADSEHPVK